MRRLYLIIGLVLAVTLACSLPGTSIQPVAQSSNAETLAAETVRAVLTQGATTVPAGIPTQPSTEAPTSVPPTAPVPPTSTTAPPTPTTVCDQASFVEDVSVPDGTTFQTGQHFTKTWRLKNVGSCAWTSGYQLIFDHGDKMSGPDSQQLTSGVVNPGQNIDVSVNLIAPNTAGSFRGYWMLKDPGGTVFGLSTGAFWVDIKTANPTLVPLTLLPVTLMPLPLLHTINAPLIVSQSGSVRSDGMVLSVKNAGDLESNVSARVFLTFDISAIPAGATITAAKTNFTNYDTLGDPFGSLDYLRMYPMNYGTLNAGDYAAAPSLGAVARWHSTSELNTISGSDSLLTAVQGKVGSSTIQFVVYFNGKATDNDGVADMVRLGNGIKLVITYKGP